MKIKIFDSVSTQDLEDQINLFLTSKSNSHIQNISLTSSQGFFIATILYQEDHSLLEVETGVTING